MIMISSFFFLNFFVIMYINYVGTFKKNVLVLIFPSYERIRESLMCVGFEK